MGAKQQALKNAARRRMAETGQSYEAALQDVRREYEQGRIGDEHDEPRNPMGFDEAADATEYSSPTSTYVTGYFVAKGVHELADDGQLRQLIDHAEKHGQPGHHDPILCNLCDEPVVVTKEREVHVGLALREVQQPGHSKPTELQFPVWTHEGCGHTRVWSWSQLTLERRRRNLPIETSSLPPKQHRRRGRQPVEDFFAFSVPEDSPPVFYLQPGEADRHGPMGFRADRLSDGLPPLDLTRQDPPERSDWVIAADRSGPLHIEHRGMGRWYQPSRPWTTFPAWLAAAHYHQSVIFLTAPAGSVAPAVLEQGGSDLSDLLAVGRQDLLFGCRMTIQGLS
ncbi:hypothetical protein [Streptomyces sp. NPDC013489]|uniref:hypothetical protein n=1 Tax=Streptomyces sp. NPDC013489 TaxID=3155606 RepID=UPI0034093EF2